LGLFLKEKSGNIIANGKEDVKLHPIGNHAYFTKIRTGHIKDSPYH
jgi:hypothetical protein